MYYTNFPLVLEGYIVTLVGSLVPVITRQRLVRYLPSVVERVVSWASKKPKCISHFTMESKFIVLAVIGKEIE